jgi:hypothetical protein
MHMLDNKTREALEKLIGVVVAFLPLILSSLRAGKEDFQIQNESDYRLGLVHGMVISGFLSSFFTLNMRGPNQQEIMDVSKVLFDRKVELREAVFKTLKKQG